MNGAYTVEDRNGKKPDNPWKQKDEYPEEKGGTQNVFFQVHSLYKKEGEDKEKEDKREDRLVRKEADAGDKNEKKKNSRVEFINEQWNCRKEK